MRLPGIPRSCSMRSSCEPSGANAVASSSEALTKNSASANVCHAASSSARRENRLTPSFANARYAASVIAVRPVPTAAKRGGNSPSRCKLYSAGSSFRCARSPAPPKMTSVTGSRAIGGVCPTASCSKSDSGILLHRVAAELVAKRREHPFGERIVLARAKAGEKRRRQHRQRHGAIDPFMQRPPALARVFDVALQRGEFPVFRQRARGELEQPGADDAAFQPERRDRGEVEVVVAGVHQLEALGIRLHEAVFDAVVDHLHVMARNQRSHPPIA